MKKILISIAFLMSPTISYSENLCSNTNNVLFSCAIEKSKKSVSVCKSGDSVTYIYGTLEKVDITLPENNNKSLVSLNYELFATGETKGIVFARGDYQYIVQNVFGGKPPSEWDEVVVVKGGKSVATLTCSNTKKTDGDIQGTFEYLKKKGFKVVEN